MGYIQKKGLDKDDCRNQNEYAGSTLQQKMNEIVDGFPAKEQAVISQRSFTGGGTYDNPSVDSIAGQGIDSQKLWPLSTEERITIKNDSDTATKSEEVLAFGNRWWLRTPYPDYGYASWRTESSGKYVSLRVVYFEDTAVRPALSLNLSSVLFTSVASETSGKASATAGSGLVSAEAPAGTVKFTMKDSSQALTVIATQAQSQQQAQTLEFSYSGATKGNNQYVSCILTDSTGTVKYYGKLADSSNAESGDLSIPLSGIADGTYTLQIFSEEANGALYTDFCSEPVTMKVSVSSGTGTVSEFSGTILHEHSWAAAWSYDETGHWHECTASGCPVTDNSQKDGYAAHTYDQQVVNDTYKASEATCTEPEKYYYSCVCGGQGIRNLYQWRGSRTHLV